MTRTITETGMSPCSTHSLLRGRKSKDVPRIVNPAPVMPILKRDISPPLPAFPHLGHGPFGLNEYMTDQMPLYTRRAATIISAVSVQMEISLGFSADSATGCPP